ncbi:hypothetical protein [Acidihalobacter ferrooxydans]|uniref:Galactose oxidase n=1 Tax=Acidihalobacter ferrooxydans TaxID=1765967 RepID=A0A1P8UGQ9_9GAMM|nr:hypothetical protein [Acidihalobacter ferrooxydans]APZ42954.1 hypothetical protein BW247_07490 [Acidihalobacter ferrooxydans]
MVRRVFVGLLLSVLVVGFALPAAAAQLRVMPDGRLPVPMIGVAVSVSPHGNLTTVGGFTGRHSLAEIYTRRAGRWQVLAHLPAPMHDAASGWLNGTLFIFGGGQAYSTRDLFRVQGGHTVRVAYLGHPLSDAIARPYRWHGEQGLILVGGHGGPPVRKVYFITGHAGHTRWHTLFSLPVGVRYAAVAVDGRTVYIAGGLATRGHVDTAWAWRPGDTGPVRLPALPQSLDKAAAFAWHGTVYVVGGLRNGGRVSADILAYRPGQRAWRVAGHLPRPLADMGYVQKGPNGYLLGGMTDGNPQSASDGVLRLRLD